MPLLVFSPFTASPIRLSVSKLSFLRFSSLPILFCCLPRFAHRPVRPLPPFAQFDAERAIAARRQAEDSRRSSADANARWFRQGNVRAEKQNVCIESDDQEFFFAPKATQLRAACKPLTELAFLHCLQEWSSLRSFERSLGSWRKSISQEQHDEEWVKILLCVPSRDRSCPCLVNTSAARPLLLHKSPGV
jgi:hypothetical protein